MNFSLYLAHSCLTFLNAWLLFCLSKAISSEIISCYIQCNISRTLFNFFFFHRNLLLSKTKLFNSLNITYSPALLSKLPNFKDCILFMSVQKYTVRFSYCFHQSILVEWIILLLFLQGKLDFSKGRWVESSRICVIDKFGLLRDVWFREKRNLDLQVC